MTMFSFYRRTKIFLLLLICLAGGFCRAGILSDLASGKFANADAAADRYEYVGGNILASGHVSVVLNDMLLTADRAIFNPEMEDMELVGNVTLTIQDKENKSLTPEEYQTLSLDPYVNIQVTGYETTPSGQKKIKVSTRKIHLRMKAQRISGNMKTGLLQMRNFDMQAGILFCSGEQAERRYDGRITVRNAKMSTCNYLADEHDHFGIFTKEATIEPRKSSRGLFNYNADQGEHSIWAWNNFIEIYGVPVFWLPLLHKPRDLSSFGGKIEFGRSSERGFFIRSAKNFQLMDEPYLNTNIMLDFFSERGFGYGVGLDFLTPESSTELTFYGIKDWDPYHYWDNSSSGDNERWAENNSRLKIPSYRYEFRIANLTHLLPNLDFRGQIDKLSDYNFLNDYFPNRYNSVLEPATFASLEYQHERFTASLYTNFRINSFNSTVEHLPELRFDFQRQELFKNLYYQGETSFDYLQMKWREFDRPRPYIWLQDPKDYSSFRFDTLHMFYYPMKFFNINIIPRAGFRLTAYSKSSDRSITSDELNAMFVVDRVDGRSYLPIVSYDNDGGSQLRFTGEVGVEVNTKFYHAWQNVKSAYWDLDGLRHVIQPYVNYTYIPKPSVDCDNLYYFDEVDRITEQNFIRLGLVNRLQTRRSNQVTEIFSMENYWDYFFHKTDGFNSIGDFGTILRFNPGHGLSLVSLLLLDMGQNNEHDAEVYRGTESAGRPGLNWKFLNRWETTFAWEFAPDWKISASYLYSDSYRQRTPYSMGTSFASTNATSMFLSWAERSQQCSAALDFPILFDDKMKGSVSITYDVDKDLINNCSLALKRRFHCIDLTAAIGAKTERDSDNDKARSFYFSFYVSLAALPSVGTGYDKQ